MQRILYVEDDLSLIDGLQYTLEASGYMVDNAKTVKDTCFSGKDPQNESNDILFAGNHAATLLISTFRIVVFMPDVH